MMLVILELYLKGEREETWRRGGEGKVLLVRRKKMNQPTSVAEVSVPGVLQAGDSRGRRGSP